MPPGSERDEENSINSIELTHDRDAGILLRSSSAPATFDHPHPLERQAETRDLRYDPISLKEPQDLHSWDWLGCPARFINFALHKSVQEVDGRDQHCALLFWLFILLGFIAYGAFLFAGPIQQRDHPPQYFGALDDPEDLAPIAHLPYMVNWTGIKPELNASTMIKVSSRGWVTKDPARVDVKGIHRSSFEDYDLTPPTDMLKQCDVKGCFYFDGPGYSAFPNESMSLDTRWISFTTTVRLPEKSKDDWAVMNALIYAGLETPTEACLSMHVKPFMSVMPLSRRTKDYREFGMERVRLKYVENIKLKKRYHLLPSQSTYHKDYFEMSHVGNDVALKAWNETQEAEMDGYVTFAGAVSFRVLPMIVLYRESEPVNILTILCAIAGIWTAFVVVFKILFPSHNSGRRRVISALRPWVSRIMPRKKSEALQSLVRVLPPEERYNFGPVAPPTQSRRKSTSNVGEVEGLADIKETEEGGREGEENKEPQGGRARLFSVFPRMGSFNRTGGAYANEHVGPDARLVALELPGPEERLHEVEQTMKLMVAELQYLRMKTQASPSRPRPGFNIHTGEAEAPESRTNNKEYHRFRSLPNGSP